MAGHLRAITDAGGDVLSTQFALQQSGTTLFTLAVVYQVPRDKVAKLESAFEALRNAAS